VALGNGIVGVVGTLRTSNNMPPPCSDTSASGNSDDVVVLVRDAGVAREASIVNILDGLG